MSVSKIRKNDTVMVTTGVSAGKTGKVLQVFPSRMRVVVEGVNLVKKNLRKSQDNPHGGIIEKEGSIAVSNLMLYCPECKKGVKAGRVREADKSVRRCKICGHVFEV